MDKPTFWNTLARRLGIQVEISWQWNMAHHLTVRRFLISADAKYNNKKWPYNCVWPHAWICILGLSIGAGFFYTRWDDIMKREMEKVKL